VDYDDTTVDVNLMKDILREETIPSTRCRRRHKAPSPGGTPGLGCGHRRPGPSASGLRLVL